MTIVTAHELAQPSGLDSAATPGSVYWITGLSGSGKSTTARLLAARLREQQRSVIMLDGDDLRAVYGDGLAFTTDDRRVLAMRHARLCRLLSNQGFDVICATISLFHDCHDWCRANLAHYREVYLRVSLLELQRRDARGLYRPSTNDVVGVDLPVEEPRYPDVLIDNDGSLTPQDVADCVWQGLISPEVRETRAG